MARKPKNQNAVASLGAEADFDIPLVTHAISTDEIIMPNALSIVPDSTFKARAVRERNRPSEFWQSAVFRYKDQNYIFGQEAESAVGVDHVTGPQKYNEGTLDVMVLSALLKFLPEGHNNVVIGCAHTTDAVPYVDKIASILNGKHTVTRANGETVKYVVRAVIPWDEPAGGVLRFMSRPYAEYNPHDLNVGDKVVVVDIGGKVSSVFPALIQPGMKVEIFWRSGKAFDLGIQDVTEALESEFKSLYSDDFQYRSIAPRVLSECLRRKGMTRLRSEPYDATQAYLNAVAPMLDQMERIWTVILNGGQDVDHIVATGGGSGLLFESLFDVFNHNHIYTADDAQTINFANVRGGKYAVSMWAGLNGHLLKPGAVYVIVDPGNSDLKATIIRG